MAKYYSLYRLVIISCFLLLISQDISGQFFYGIRQEYGKNRVQYNQFDWVYYRFERYDVYFYTRNDELAAQVAQMAGTQLARIENLLDAPLDERVQILVFNNLSDLKQSNVNSSTEEDYSSSGVTRMSGSRLFVHFNGDYVQLESELRSGIVEVVLSNMAYGSFTQSIRNSALLNLPEWYTEGLISYIGKPNIVEYDVRVRDAYLSGKYKNINALYGEDARFAGHSIWTYLADIYGQKMIKNVVYMAIVNRNVESGFLYILGKDMDAILTGWHAYLDDKYGETSMPVTFVEKPLIKAPKDYVITRMATAPDGRYMSFVCQKFSRYKVYIYDTEKGKKKRIKTDGYRISQNVDYSFPLITWHPNGKILAMITEEKGFIYLNFYDREKKKWEKKSFFQFDKINSFEYSKDGKQFVLSANKDGQSDIFIYTILNTKITQLTKDTYADFNPTWIQNDKRVVFSSNRPSNQVVKGDETFEFVNKRMDIFAMEAKEPRMDTSYIWQLTNSPGVSELKPMEYEPGYLSFLSSRGDILNRNLIKIDSSIAFVDTTTHYEYSFREFEMLKNERSIIDHAYDAHTDKDLLLTLHKKRFKIFETPHVNPEDLIFTPVKGNSQSKLPANTPETPVRQVEIANRLTESVNPLYYPGVNLSEFEINIEDYKFDRESNSKKPEKNQAPQEPKVIKLLPAPVPTVTVEGTDTVEIPPKRNYFLSLYKDELTIGFDNIFENPQYQPFTGRVSSDLLNSGFNMKIKLGVFDLMHDYKVTAAMSTNFQPLAGTAIFPNSEFLIAVTDDKKRLDKSYIYARRSRVDLLSYFNYQRYLTNEVAVKLSYPFTPVTSVRGSIGYRHDERIQLSRESISLAFPDINRDFATLRLAFVYDNTRKIGVNLYSGLRYKIFTEYYRNLNSSPSGLHTAGVDLRNYTVIHKNMVWANRFAVGTSFGPEKLIYIMGGVDNSFSPDVNPTTPMADENYIFQTLVTNMRGFYQNVRNGNSFVVINSELRWPIFSYLSKAPIKSDFIKNFMVIGFGDIGTAWNGVSPYSDENAINTRVVPFGAQGGSSKVIIDSQKDPFVGSYGFGLRTRLFGYYLRFDWAWPIEDAIQLPSEFTFSLGLDF